MGFRISTNVNSLVANRNLANTKLRQGEHYQKLSSGSRINKAADDAAGLAISENLKAQIRSGRQAERNASDGISLVQVAEGGMNEISNILIRMRELSMQASSDTIGDTERSFTDLEFQQLTQEIDRISGGAEFNGRKLLNGEGGTVELQVGIGSDDNSRIAFLAEDIDVTTGAVGLEGLTISSKDEARSNLEKIDSSIDIVNKNRAKLGALQNRLTSTVSNLMIQNEGLSGANSRIRDSDIAVETAELTKSNVLEAAGVSVLSQANSSATAALKLLS